MIFKTDTFTDGDQERKIETPQFSQWDVRMILRNASRENEAKPTGLPPLESHVQSDQQVPNPNGSSPRFSHKHGGGRLSRDLPLSVSVVQEACTIPSIAHIHETGG